FKKEDSNMAETYVLSPRFQGDTSLIYRTSKDLSKIDPADGDRARAEIDKGASWVSFSGHGSTGVVDIEDGLPYQFNNEHRYFVFGTFSCQTGAFADPVFPSRNEQFITIPGKGAIATFGNTSYSWTDIDFILKQFIYSNLTEPRTDTSMTN